MFFKKERNDLVKKFIEKNFDEHIILARFKNNKEGKCVVSVGGSPFDIFALIKGVAAQNPEFLTLLRATIETIDCVEKMNKDIKEELNKDNKKSKKSKKAE